MNPGILIPRQKPLGWAFAAGLSICAVLSILAGMPILLAGVPALLLFVACTRDPRPFHLILMVLIPLSMEVRVAGGLGTDMPDEPIMWMLTLPVASLLLQEDDRAKTVRGHLIFRLLLVHWLWACVTIIFSTHPLLSVKYALAKTWYILPFAAGAVLFLDTRERLVRAAMAIIFPMAAASIWVFTRHAAMGFAFDKVNDAVRPLFRNHVNYSALLVCLLPISVAAAFLSRKYRKAFIALSLFWLVAIFVTYSRGAWMAIPVGGMTAWALHRKRIAIMATIAGVILLGTIAFLATNNRYLDYRPDFDRTIYHSDLAGHIQATYRLRDLSTAERFHRWIAAFRMMDGHWLQGYGPNSFYPEYKTHVVNAFRTYVSANPEHSTVHDYFLLLLTEQGLPGLIFFLVLLGAVFHAMSRTYHRSSDRFTRTVMLTLSAMLGMIITLIALSDLIETDKVGSIFYTLVGLVVGARFWKKDIMNAS